MAWFSLTVDIPELESELSQAVLYENGASGLEVRDSLTPTMKNVRAPNKGEAILIAYFENRDEAKAAQDELTQEVPTAKFELEEVVERDWSTEWRSQIRSVQVGRLWVGPPWEKANAPADKVCLFIEPKMAFGTGDHPTTSLCLAAVDDFMAQNPGCDMLDVGTGTGVLAFAAKKLGANRVIGVDNDTMSVQLAKECAEENGISGVELSTKTLHGIEGQFELVLANILANTLIELAPLIAPKVKKRLVLAGTLVHQKDEVTAAFVAQGLKPVGTTTQGEWIRIDLDR